MTSLTRNPDASAIAYARVSTRDQNSDLRRGHPPVLEGRPFRPLHAHVLTVITELRERGVAVVSLTDLATKEGRFMFTVLAAAAEFETELRAERQAEGIAAAKRRQAGGQILTHRAPRVVGAAEAAALRHLIGSGISVTEAARTLKISRSTAYNTRTHH